MINREDCLELTRRMTLKRTHFTRIAGCYVDAEGDFDGSFNTFFSKLSASEREKKLKIAKCVPFAASNETLREVRFPDRAVHSKELWKLLYALTGCELKNDAALDVFYDLVMDAYRPGTPYAVLLFHGAYDIPRKSSAGEYQGESEEVYKYLICTVCPLTGEYEPGEPDFGFLYPAFSDRSADLEHVDVYAKNAADAQTAQKILFG